MLDRKQCDDGLESSTVPSASGFMSTSSTSFAIRTQENTAPKWTADDEDLGTCYVLEKSASRARGRLRGEEQQRLSISRRSRRSLSRHRPDSVLAVAEDPKSLLDQACLFGRGDAEVVTSSTIAAKVVAEDTDSQQSIVSRRRGSVSFLHKPKVSEVSANRKHVDTEVPATPPTISLDWLPKSHQLPLQGSVAVWLDCEGEEEMASGNCELLKVSKPRVSAIPRRSNVIAPQILSKNGRNSGPSFAKKAGTTRRTAMKSPPPITTHAVPVPSAASVPSARTRMTPNRPPPMRRPSTETRTPVQVPIPKAHPQRASADARPPFNRFSSPVNRESVSNTRGPVNRNRQTLKSKSVFSMSEPPLTPSVLLKRLADHSREVRDSHIETSTDNGSMRRGFMSVPHGKNDRHSVLPDLTPDFDSPSAVIDQWTRKTFAKTPSPTPPIPRRSLAGLTKSTPGFTKSTTWAIGVRMP